MSLNGTLQPPGTTLVLSAQTFDGPVTFTGNAPVTAQGGTTTQSLSGTGTAPTVAAGAGAGVGATITLQKGHDIGGSFVITAAGTPAAGVDATVTFGTALAAAPASILFQIQNTTTNAPVTTCYLTSITATGFAISNTAALVATDTYLVNYQVVAS